MKPRAKSTAADRSPTCAGRLCSKGLCPGTLLLGGLLLVQGIIALVKWITL